MLKLKLQSLATSCKELTHWKRPWFWVRLGAGGEGDNREWGGWMASPTRWTWVWVKSGSWWWTGRPGMLVFMGSQRVGHYWATELTECFTEALVAPIFRINYFSCIWLFFTVIKELLEIFICSWYFVVQLLSHFWLFETSWTVAHRLPCPSLSPGVCSNPCPLSRWGHSTISSSVVPFSCPQSLPASGSFPMSQLFAWDGSPS